MRLGLLLVGMVLAGAALTGAAFATSPGSVSALGGSDSAAAAGNATENTTGNVSMGTALSSYMQSQSAKSAGEVEQGMWNASFERNRSAEAVQDRAATLASQLAAVREQRRALQAAYENGSISEMQYRARMARLDARLDALARAVDETRPAAKATGVNASRLDRIGTEIAETRRKVPDHAGPPETPPGRADDRTGGPPSAAPGNDASNGTGPGNATRTPGHDGTPPGQTNQTPPGQANRTPGAQGNGTAAGPGNRTANESIPGHPANASNETGNRTLPDWFDGNPPNGMANGTANQSNVSSTVPEGRTHADEAKTSNEAGTQDE